MARAEIRAGGRRLAVGWEDGGKGGEAVCGEWRVALFRGTSCQTVIFRILLRSRVE